MRLFIIRHRENVTQNPPVLADFGISGNCCDTTTGEERHQLPGHQGDIRVPIFTNDGKTLIASDEKFIRFWDVETGKQIRELKLSAPVGAIVLSPDNRLFATVGAEKFEFNNANGLSGAGWFNSDQIILHDLQTGKEVHRLAKHHNGVMLSAYPLAFSPDGKSFVSSDFKSVRWWDVATGKETPERNMHVPFVNLVAFSLDGKTFAAGSSAIQIWDLETSKPKGPQRGHQSGIYCTAVSPDGKILATGGSDPLRLWHAATGEELRQFPSQEGGHWFIRFVSNGKRLVSGSGSENTTSFVHIWEIATGKEIRRIAGSEPTLSADGRLLATRSNEKLVQIWDVSTGEERGKWKSELGNDGTMSFSPDGQSIYEYGSDKKVYVRKGATGEPLRQFEGHHFKDADDRIYCVAFSPDGRLVGFGGQDNQVALYDMATGKNTALLNGASNGVSTLAFSADSRVLASSGFSDGTIQVWEIATGQSFRKFVGHKGRVFSMTFTDDGKSLLSGSADTTGLVWDVAGPSSRRTSGALPQEKLNDYWAHLASQDAELAQDAVGILASRPKQAVPLCRKYLPPIAIVDAERIERLLARLNDDSFQIRTAANRDLEELAYSTQETLRRALEKAPPLEPRRRIEMLLAKLEQDPNRLRNVRILQLLEQSGTPEMRDVLRSLAGGAAGAWLTKEAQMALDRLARRP